MLGQCIFRRCSSIVQLENIERGIKPLVYQMQLVQKKGDTRVDLCKPGERVRLRLLYALGVNVITVKFLEVFVECPSGVILFTRYAMVPLACVV